MSRLPFKTCGQQAAALLAVAAYPALFVYFHNIGEAVFTQIFLPVFLFAAAGLAAWLFFGLLSASVSRGALVALLFLPVFMYYALIDDGIRALAPDWRWWRTAPAFLFLFSNLALALRIVGKRPAGDAVIAKMTTAIGAVFFGLILFNAAGGIYALTKMPRAERSTPASGSGPGRDHPAVSSGSRRPDVYILIFDEYARQDILKKYAGYDNTPFLRELERRRFNVSYSSYSTASRTDVATANLYHYAVKYKTRADVEADADSPALLRRPPLFDVFKKAGYKIHLYAPSVLKSDFDEGLIDVTLKHFVQLKALSIEKTVVAQSFLLYVQGDTNEAIRSARLSRLRMAARIIGERTGQPKLLYFHLTCPHGPFVFNEHGGPVAYENMENIGDPQYYTGQLRFMSRKILELADGMLEKDPGAVMLLQSDHGPRFFGIMPEREMRACLNVLYASGRTVSIEGLSTVDTLRLAMNHALGLKLELLGEGGP